MMTITLMVALLAFSVGQPRIHLPSALKNTRDDDERGHECAREDCGDCTLRLGTSGQVAAS